MRKIQLLLLAIFTLLGVNSAHAYSTDDLTNAGWTKVTDLSALTLSDNYFMFVDAGASASALAVGNPATGDRPSYFTLANPFAAAQQVWIIAATGDNYTIQNYVNNKFFVSGDQGWNDSMSDNADMGDFTFTLNDGKYTIARSTGNVGPWNDNGAIALSDGYENAAVNKAAAKAPGFFVYSIARTAYNAARRNGSALAAEGWSQVTAADGLGKKGYYYALLDVSEAGYESGFAMTGATNGRPQSQALTDPVTNKAQLWTIAAHDADKFALQCVQDGKYFRCDGAGWNTGFIDNIDADGTDFIFTLNDGKWTLSNEKDAGSFVGRWGNSAYHPFHGESIAANKAAGGGKKQYLIYSIPTIAGVATELPASGEMAADTWYYIDITAAANNYTATATTLADIVYTTDGTTLVKNTASITANFTATDNTLAATRYYVKSSSANKLTVGVASFTYTVGDATPSIADGAYISGLTTIDFAFNGAGSTDPDAVFALLNNTATATLMKGEEAVKEGTLALNGKVLTATFADVTLDLNSTYTLAVAAGVVGYEGQETNAAISTTFKTGLVAEGLYYFQKKDTQKFLGRGGNWGTQAVVAEFGISYDLTLLPNGAYQLKNHDWSLAANANKYLGFSTTNNDYFVDRGEDQFTLVAAEGGYVLKTSNDKFTKTAVNEGHDVAFEYLTPTDVEGEATIWSLINKETYAANVAAIRNAEAAAVATTAGKTAATVAELTAVLASDYVASDVTSSIKNADCTANLDNWTQVNYGDGNKNFDANGTTGEVWDGFGGIKQDIAGLEAGIYKVSVRATWRPGNKLSGERAGNDINTNAWVYANTATSSNLTQLKSWYAGGATIDSRADMKASGDAYLNDVYVYVSEGETLTIGLASPSKCNGAWMPFFGWSLTRYAAPVTAEIVADPANEATVEKLSSVTLTFNGATTVDAGSKANNVTITSDKGYNAGCTLDYGEADNQMVVKFTEVTEAATYTITFPENAFTSDAIIPAFTLTYTIAAPQQEGLVLNPAPGNVAWLTDITLSAADAPTKSLSAVYNATEVPHLIAPNGDKIALDGSSVYKDGASTYHLVPRLLNTTAGEYTLVIPDNYFSYNDDNWQKVNLPGKTVKYNVAGGDTQAFTSVPAINATVNKFKDIVITFPGATTVAVNSGLSIILYQDTTTWKGSASLSYNWTYDGNTMTYSSYNEVIDAGRYTMVFPEGCLLIDGQPSAPFMVDFKVVEPEPLNMVVTPAKGAEVTGVMNSAVITFPDETDVTYNAGSITLYRIEGEKEISVGGAYGATTTVKQDDGKTFKVSFNGMATKSGSYKITIPKNLFSTAQSFNADTTVTFTYTAPATAPKMVVTPAKGAELDRVQKFTVTFPEEENVSINTTLSGNLSLYKGVPYYNEYGYLVASSHSTATFSAITPVEGKTNEFTFSFSNPGIEAGEYTLTIPAGVFLIGTENFNATDTLTYKATGEGLDKIVATPSKPVTKLKNITLTFVNETSVVFQTAYSSATLYKVNPEQSFNTYKENVSATKSDYNGYVSIDETQPNKLNIELKDEYTEEGDYYLDLGSNFLYMSDGKTPNTVNKVYFTVVSEVTGIKNINTVRDEQTYTIGGVKVKDMNRPGLYIQNGKKVVKK